MKLGEHNLNTPIDCERGQCADPPQVIYTKTITVPKEYDDFTLKHDLALIELSEPASITRYVSPVCLPTEDLQRRSLLQEIVEVAGWGWYDIDDPKSSPVLQFVMLPVVPLDKCRKIQQLKQYNFGDGQICVGGVAGKGNEWNSNECFPKLLCSWVAVSLRVSTTGFFSENLGMDCGRVKSDVGGARSFVYLLCVKQFSTHPTHLTSSTFHHR